jgi:hypothetical protein
VVVQIIQVVEGDNKMKGVLYLSFIGVSILSLIGCQTVPRHLVREEVVIYYYEPPIVDLQPIEGPYPPRPPVRPITRPGINNPPPRNEQSKTPDNGGSYGKRDPLQGGSSRKSGETKTHPPVKKPENNARVQ